MKEELLAKRVGGFTRVLGVTKLKKRYQAFKDRRELVAGYSAFFCDDRCITMMPKLCGKAFFAAKKAPLPVRLTSANIAAELERARDSTWMRVGAQCVGLKVGRANFTAAQLAENISAALAPAVEKFPKKWKGVQSIFLRGHDTIGLPLFKSLPSQGLEVDEEEARADALEDDGDEEEDEEDEEEEEEEEEEVKLPASRGAGKSGPSSKAKVLASGGGGGGGGGVKKGGDEGAKRPPIESQKARAMPPPAAAKAAKGGATAAAVATAAVGKASAESAPVLPTALSTGGGGRGGKRRREEAGEAPAPPPKAAAAAAAAKPPAAAAAAVPLKSALKKSRS